MCKYLIQLYFFLIVVSPAEAQVLPKDSDTLNYRLVGFLFPALESADECKLEIATGTLNDEESFNKSIVSIAQSKENKLIRLLPYWNKEYTWRITYLLQNKALGQSNFYHFSVYAVPEVDTANMRLRITHNNEKYKHALVFLDANRALYDMNGEPVWFLPGKAIKGAPVSDLKLSPRGTITFLSVPYACEVNYQGDILWMAPDFKTASYHHQFSRLSNGNYMVLGLEDADWRPGMTKLDKIKTDTGNTSRPKIRFETLTEYNGKGELVWSWHSSAYFLTSDVNYANPYANLSDIHSREIMDTHANAFCFDEKNKNIYIGYKVINRILKIGYPGGNVINYYGKQYGPKMPVVQAEMFCGQHSMGINHTGNLFIYNNNFCNQTSPAEVLVAREPPPGKHSLQKIWAYQCRHEDNSPIKSDKGGNVVELSDNSFFVCTGMPYGKVFIVGPDKKILWSAIPERWDTTEKKWLTVHEYRASIIENTKQLEQLIWNTEK